MTNHSKMNISGIIINNIIIMTGLMAKFMVMVLGLVDPHLNHL